MNKFIILDNSPARMGVYRGATLEYKTLKGKLYVKVHGIDDCFKLAGMDLEELLKNGRPMTKLEKALK